jgi:hypothetical protein
MSEIRFLVPLPPKELRANSRALWPAKKRAADAYSGEVYWAFDQQVTDPKLWPVGPPFPWQRARVHYVWRYRGVEPDQGNIGASTKALQDVLCVAPKLGIEQAKKYSRFHIGIVENDRGITATYETEHVDRRDQQGVYITLVEEDADGS